MLVLLLTLACVLSVVSFAKEQSYVSEQLYSDIKASETDKLVLLYHSSEGQSEPLLDFMNYMAKHFHEQQEQEKDEKVFEFITCDGDIPENAEEVSKASMRLPFYLFTQTSEEGIQRYTHDYDLESILSHIKFLTTSPKANKLVPFKSEAELVQKKKTRPQFVKFYQEWCRLCQTVKKPFLHAAEQLEGVVDFVEVHCSGSEEEKAYCEREGVSSYPTIKLMDEDELLGFHEKRTALGFLDFINQHMDRKERNLASTAD